MTSSSENTDKDKSVRWIKIGIAEEYINYHDYGEFRNIQRIGYGAHGQVYRATWENSNTVVALKCFEYDNVVMKEVVNEVIKVVYTILTILNSP